MMQHTSHLKIVFKYLRLKALDLDSCRYLNSNFLKRYLNEHLLGAGDTKSTRTFTLTLTGNHGL